MPACYFKDPNLIPADYKTFISIWTVRKDNNKEQKRPIKLRISSWNIYQRSTARKKQGSEKYGGGGQHSSAIAIAPLNPAAPGSNLGISKIFSEIPLSPLDAAMIVDSKDSVI